ncbi:hypothetical protein DIE18_18285 [Burkholderia sp. Bp9125]|nr:hypothetical protein DIE18_18285 [Burkholderia sp. Bp9125]
MGFVSAGGPRCGNGRLLDGHNRRRAAPRASSARPGAAIWRFSGKLAIIRWPESIATLFRIVFAHSCSSDHSRRQSCNPTIIADQRQALTHLKKFKHGPSDAHRAASAFRDAVRHACAARRACEPQRQEARRR